MQADEGIQTFEGFMQFSHDQSEHSYSTEDWCDHVTCWKATPTTNQKSGNII